MAPSGKQHVVHVTSTDAKDDFSHLSVVEADIPTPGEGEVLVNVYLRPVNPTDVLQAAGTWGHTAPFIDGSEGVGKVEELGPGTTGRLSKGQRVVAADWGKASWQQYIIIKEDDLVGVPDDVKDEDAATVLIGALTTMGMLEQAAVPQGGWLLQAAAASSVGRQVILLAKSWGIKTINVVRSDNPEQHQELKHLGADEIINSSKEDLVARVKEITGGEGAYAALDPVAGITTGQMASALRKGGSVYVYGFLSDVDIHVPVIAMYGGIKIDSFLIYTWLPDHGPEGARMKFEEAFKLFQSGVLRNAPGKRYPLTEVRAAMIESVKPGRTSKQPKVFLEG
mmetsp:Transcript_1051/g.3213  ORF Transcript_1051/g.3213 Transcript_1051/m.3213 type:complete len:338 (+) Transcript_1051:236-1249(+)|eukprot:CAMPEP_0206138922 /NCGR_PEP_ID=MMETSP1473-20131121/3987_1 /ASSEMBLY_ACC=CAM_ASM_001109 /TAXON_ID=1461547 /ORGANISM="Stichococcus sp, Strain RCC1054" /LENGTH=337 /DNA_ID=CAMNT_0053532485 /DNA_START=210 /DNA_END=1223 /DNA_ORIENTATION=-